MNWLKSWLEPRQSSPAKRSASARRARQRQRMLLGLEGLEDRVVPTLTIVPTFAANIQSDPNAATIEATIKATIAIYASYITDNRTVNVTFQESNGSVTSGNLSVGKGGVGYTSPPNVTFTPVDGGSGASAVAVVQNGQVTGFTNIQPGSGYIQEPKVSLSGGGGAARPPLWILGSVGALPPRCRCPMPAILPLWEIYLRQVPPKSLRWPVSPLARPARFRQVSMSNLRRAAQALGFYTDVAATTGSGAVLAFTASADNSIATVNAVPVAGGSGYPANATAASPIDLYVYDSDGGGGVVQATTDANGVVTSFLPTPVAGGWSYASGANQAYVYGAGATISLNMGICNLSRPDADPTKYDLQSVTMHELDEVLGAGGAGSKLNPAKNPVNAGDPLFGTAAPGPLDLFRYSQSTVINGTAVPGHRVYNYFLQQQAYFSIDGGYTDLARFNQTAGGDFGDDYSVYGNQSPQV